MLALDSIATERQRLAERLARIDAERTKLTEHLAELEAAERVPSRLSPAKAASLAAGSALEQHRQWNRYRHRLGVGAPVVRTQSSGESSGTAGQGNITRHRRAR